MTKISLVNNKNDKFTIDVYHIYIYGRLMKDIKKTFLKDCETFLKETGVTATDLGINAIKSGHLMRRIRDGKSCNADTMDTVYSYMKKYRKKHGFIRAQS